MVSTIAQTEAAFLKAWPALETVSDGQWCARFGNGLTRRANCIQVNDADDDGDGDAAARLKNLAALYDDRRLLPYFRVTPLTGRATFDALVQAGWAASDYALIMQMPIGETVGVDGECVVTSPDDQDFLAAQSALQGYGGENATTFAKLIAKLDSPAVGLTIYDSDGTALASLLCVEASGIGVFLNVSTAPAARRQGLGTRLMASAISWLAENGATEAALQVAADNRAAVALYLSMGFSYRYPYHYRRRLETKAS
ncbi:Acetyltransferase (GNAT) family protein [Pelagibacterium luteolum]|uniref:Acetyltransferase (GNAT) family protein n=1 Tax=Pelagibacterium luteolum TaxID=440168 RepID=A0A1G7RPA8_9HYPH|nr:Acetyltransferase (GNAT) family protein [Pelagibacterium luteolum]